MSLKRQRGLEGFVFFTNNADVEQRTPSKKSKKVPLQKATVIKVPVTEPTTATCNVADHIIERIRKCWERGNHPTAAESEAKTALFLASRLMSQYNVNLADLLPKETPENRAQLAGSTNVSIRSTKGDDRRVVHQGFVSTLAQSMDIFFDCKSYSCRQNVGICWTFYGIAKNADTAAQAFEMTHNKIVEWACAYSGTAASFSYCQGIADGLLSMAYKQKRQETEKARKQEEENLNARSLAEKLQRQKELERLGGPCEDVRVGSSPQTYSEEKYRDDDASGYGNGVDVGYDDNDENEGGDFLEYETEPDFAFDSDNLLNDAAELDEEIEQVLRQQSSLSNREKNNSTSPKVAKANTRHATHVKSIISCWSSEMQLVQFRQTAEQVANEYLKAANIKLYSNTAKKTTVKDPEAYRQGKKDSKKLDVRQKLVE